MSAASNAWVMAQAARLAAHQALHKLGLLALSQSTAALHDGNEALSRRLLGRVRALTMLPPPSETAIQASSLQYMVDRHDSATWRAVEETAVATIRPGQGGSR